MPSWGEQWSCSENNAISTHTKHRAQCYCELNLRSPTLEQLQSDSGTKQQGRNSGKMCYLVTRLRNNSADYIQNLFYFRYYLIKYLFLGWLCREPFSFHRSPFEILLLKEITLRVIIVNIRGDKYYAWMGACEWGDTKQDKVMPLSGEGTSINIHTGGSTPTPTPW